ncbi:MAG: alkaline phosphatase [Planctomycetota bacterium]
MHVLALPALFAFFAVMSTPLAAWNGCSPEANPRTQDPGASRPPAKNAIFFVADGMGVSTVTATRVFSVGVGGKLVLDRMPFTAVSRTFTTDSITADSAGTMSAMITGVNTNTGVISLGPKTERNDFHGDGDDFAPMTLLELAKAAGKRIGIVSTARVTHATPAACFAHVNDRDKEAEIAAQGTPGEPEFNARLRNGIDLLVGGGRRFFLPSGVVDEEGEAGGREDGRNLIDRFRGHGYRYVWREEEWSALRSADLPVLALFESSHMEYEYDRKTDVGGEPSLSSMVERAIDLLDDAPGGFVLVVEGGRVDHAHHAGNAFRALVDAEEFDRAVGVAIDRVDLRDTVILATADHSHTLSIAGYPLRPLAELPYATKGHPDGYAAMAHGGILDAAYGIDPKSGIVRRTLGADRLPYTPLSYANGPGARGAPRSDPRSDRSAGFNGTVPTGPTHPDYLQAATVPLGSETHGGEDVLIWGIGSGSSALRGVVPNTACFDVLRAALGL